MGLDSRPEPGYAGHAEDQRICPGHARLWLPSRPGVRHRATLVSSRSARCRKARADFLSGEGHGGVREAVTVRRRADRSAGGARGSTHPPVERQQTEIEDRGRAASVLQLVGYYRLTGRLYPLRESEPCIDDAGRVRARMLGDYQASTTLRHAEDVIDFDRRAPELGVAGALARLSTRIGSSDLPVPSNHQSTGESMGI